MSGKTLHKLILCMLLLLLACPVIAVPAVALTGSETQITTNTADQIDPAISGDYIVYTDGRNGNKDIYLASIAGHTEVDLTPGTPNDQYLNDIDDDNIVYTDVTSSGADIYLYNLTTSLSTPLTDGGDQYSPAVEGSHVVWVQSSGGKYNAYLADIVDWTLTKVTSDAVGVAAPRVDGDWVVWEEYDTSNWQIRGYQISTGETRDITSGASNNRRPDVSGDRVVWSSDRNGNWDIYSYALSTGDTTQLTDSPGNERYTRISGDRVVWEDDRSGTIRIWTKDLTTGTEEAVSPGSHTQILTAIDGNRIVWTENRFGNYDIFLFTISPANQPPVADAGDDQTVNVNDVVTLDGSGSSDPDDNPITYTWTITTLPAGSSASLSHPTAEKPTITADKAGEYVVQLIVNDGTVDSDPDTVTVTAANQAPVADAGEDQSVGTGDSVTLDGSGSSDPDGDTITYAWEITSVPAGSTAALSGPTAEKPAFNADKDGQYVVQLIVNDGTIDSDPDTVTITAAANQPPVADAGDDQSVSVGNVAALDGSGSSDPDGDSITYAWSITTKPAGSSATLSDATAKKPGFTADKAGQYVIQLIVNDGSANSEPDTVTVTATESTITVPVDVEPGFCPNLIGVNMKGPILVITIAGTSDLDVKKIDPATIRLSREGITTKVKPRLSKVLDIATAYTPATACGCQKKLWDGKKDLVLVFDVGEVVTKLKLKDIVGTSVPLTLSGNLKSAYGSTPITGSDCTKILSVCNEKIGQNI